MQFGSKEKVSSPGDNNAHVINTVKGSALDWAPKLLV